jgi:uncharacterized protein YcbK (DUF882 family)
MLRFFDESEFACQETGENNMDMDFLLKLDALRDKCGFPFRITSGYRSKEHSIEAKKARPGRHTEGIACDIAVSNGFERMNIVHEALKMGCFNGIGIAKSFVHVDTRPDNPVMWVY